MADGFYGGYCACSYWGEAGLRWWGSDLQVVGGIDGDFGGWVKTLDRLFFFSAVVCGCSRSGWRLVAVMVGGCGDCNMGGWLWWLAVLG